MSGGARDLPAFAQRTVERAAAALGDCQMALVVWRDGDPAPYAYVIADPAGHVSLTHCLLEVGLMQERLTDCEPCAAAWGRMKMALAGLQPTSEVAS